MNEIIENLTMKTGNFFEYAKIHYKKH